MSLSLYVTWLLSVMYNAAFFTNTPQTTASALLKPPFNEATAVSEVEEFQPDELFIMVQPDVYVRFGGCDQILAIGPHVLDSLSFAHGINFAGAAFPLLKDRPRLKNIYKIHVSKPQLIAQLIRALEALPEVVYAERVPLYSTYFTPNDLQTSQWSLTQIQASEAWDIETGSPDIVVAIVDDAVLTTHEDLQANIVAGYDVADDDNDPAPPAGAATNCFSHGTHCAGIASAVTNNNTGIASLAGHVKIMPVKCKPDSDLGTNCNSLPATFSGIEYAIAHNADVISMSFGGYASAQSVQLLLDEAYANNIVCVAAAGNDNSDNPSYPASYNHVISVAASNQTDGKASFSNYGATIDVTAPGTNIYSTVASSTTLYAEMQGTSMSTPLVASLCALMRSHIPTLGVDELEACIKDNCDNIDAQNPNFVGLLGAGRINAFKAITCLQTAPVANFSFSPLQACPGQPVQFTDLSVGENISSYEWTFEGGTPATSNIANPVVSFSGIGAHNVSLSVTNSLGTNNIVRTVQIANPTAVIAGNTTIVEGFSTALTVTFTGTPPFSFTYTSNGTNPQTINDISETVYNLSVSPAETTVYELSGATDNFCAATMSGAATVTVIGNIDVPQSDNVNLPSWPIITAQGNVFDVQFYPTTNTTSVAFDIEGQASNTGVGFDECGRPLFYVLHTGSTNANALFVVTPEGTVLNAGAGYNALRGGNEMQVVPVPQTPNEWFVIYSAWTNTVVAGGDAGYTPTALLYARFFYDGTTFTAIENDVVLQSNGTTFTYAHGKAVSTITPSVPNQCYLYACRRTFNSANASIDRFVISSTGIAWQDNTGNFTATTWPLSAAASPVELSYDGTRLAVVLRNQTSAETDLVLFDTNNFTAAAMQAVNISDLIIEADGVNVLTPQTPVNAANANPNVGYLRYLDQKVHGIEFSPSGNYLYFIGGGFYTSGMSNVTYLGQIDLTTSYPYTMRLQTQLPTAAGYTAATGEGCALGASCLYMPITDIESAFDGYIYFTKGNTDTIYVLPTPEMPLPQDILPHAVNLSTPTTPNRTLAGNTITILPDGIDGKLYIDTLHRFFKLPVVISQCGVCAASATSPQIVTLTTNSGQLAESFSITQCPQYVEVCLPIDETYNLHYLGATINAVIQDGEMSNAIPFIFQTGSAAAVITPVPPQCVTNAPVVLTATPPGGVFSGNGIIADNTFDPSVAGIGTHSISYTFSDNGGCTATTTLLIEVTGVNLTATATEIICPGQSVQLSAEGGTNYIWSPAEYLDNANIANPTATPPTTTVFTVQSTADNGCVSEAISVVVVNPLPYFPNEGIDTTICQFDTLTMQLTDVLPISNYTYVWSPNVGLSDPTISNPVATITESTNYTLIITGSDGCQTSRNYTIRGDITPPALLPNPLVLCHTTGEVLSVSPAEYAQYLWHNGATSDTITATQSGIYSVSVTDNNGCTASASAEVVSSNNIPVEITGNLVLQADNPTTTLSVTDTYAHYEWSTGSQQANISITKQGNYSVTVTDSNGCTGSDVVTVTKYDPYLIVIPNAFSPNGDNTNDVFRVFVQETAQINTAIYNRWGQKVYEGSDNLSAWDGTFKGMNCEMGSYIYVVNVSFSDGEQRTLKGPLLLIR